MVELQPIKIWWLVVRHSPDYVDEDGKVWPYPRDGIAITGFDDEERAKLFAKASTTKEDVYEAIPVVKWHFHKEQPHDGPHQ